MKRLLIITIIMASTILIGFAQKKNLDKMSESRRNEYLLKTAKEAIMKHGPDYYRDFLPPIIERKVMTEDNPEYGHPRDPAELDRVYYKVNYRHDKNVESFGSWNPAEVFIWEDTGKYFMIYFGNGWAFGDLDKPETRGAEPRVMPYEKRPPLKKPLPPPAGWER